MLDPRPLTGLADRPLMVSVKVACRLIGVGNTTLWSMIKDGRLKTIKIGRRRLVVYASIEALLPADSEADA